MDVEVEDKVIDRWAKPARSTGESAAAHEEDSAADQQAKAGRKEGTIADRLVKIGETTTLFHDERGDGYAVVNSNGACKTLKLRGREFKRWLGRESWVLERKVPGEEAIRSAIAVLDAQAAHEGECIPLRYASPCTRAVSTSTWG
jgi:hypothetical protein